MAVKQGQRVELSNFSAGLITEASPLNFPPNAEWDGENFLMFRDGSRQRRLGLDWELGTPFVPTGETTDTISDSGFHVYKWEGVSGKPELDFLVVQINRGIRVYDINSPNIFGTGFIGEVFLGDFPWGTAYSFSSIEGFLVVAGGVDRVAKIEYVDNSLTLSYERLRVRDVWGLQEDESRYDEDPYFRGPLTDFHRYNLQNQSWGVQRFAEIKVPVYYKKRVEVPNPNYDPSKPTSDLNPTTIVEWVETLGGWKTEDWMTDPIKVYNDRYGKAPSNSEQVWPGLQYQPVGQDQTPFEKIFPDLWEQVIASAPKSARGYFIIDALNRGQSRAEQVQRNNENNPSLDTYSTNFPTDKTVGGPRVVAEFAGRVFYTGFDGEVIGGDKNSPNYSNFIIFSQLVKSGMDIGKCYQEGDPTSRDSADIVDTDGGFLRVSGAKDIKHLAVLGSNLFVVATNGVWIISGGSDYGFSATNYKVTKLSSVGIASKNSFVVEGDSAYFWSMEGIQSISRNQYGDYVVQNISISTIQKMYDAIPSIQKSRSFGMYDTVAKQVKWLYSEEDSYNSDTIELVLDLSLGSFTKNRLFNESAKVFGMFEGSPYNAGKSSDNVVVSSVQVVSEGDNVIVPTDTKTSTKIATRYIGLITNSSGAISYGCALYSNTSFKDWGLVDAKAFLLTGDATAGDSAVAKQMPYFTAHLLRTEGSVDADFNLNNQSSCLLQIRWDFSDSVNSGKWSMPVQLYRFRHAYMGLEEDGSYEPGYRVVTSKTKLRGRGKAFSLYFETEEEKDCRILGWAMTLNGNAVT